MMAPSLESSSRGTLPIQQSSPVRAMGDMIRDYLDYQHLQTTPMDEDSPVIDPPASLAPPLFMRTAVETLSTTSASFLTSSSPLQSTSAPPAFKPYTISPIKHESRYTSLLSRPPQTAAEAELMLALQESEGRDNKRKLSMVNMQASTILAGMYTNRAQSQVQAAEERKRKKGGKRKMGDGNAKYFSGDDFFKMVEDDDRRREEEAAEKDKRQKQRQAHAVELAAWQQANEAVRERNKKRREEHAADVAAWEVEKAAAKAAKRRPGWVKPKLADYQLEVLLPRPKKVVEDEEDDENDDEGSGNGSDDGQD
ncbi:centromere protein B [Favolaschia claudopus]|uniref:Centromere protein B n=1 Tax=Favolaschia claudopus TaxID=2862362 RepID=A0AAW0AEB3_9AGAR